MKGAVPGKQQQGDDFVQLGLADDVERRALLGWVWQGSVSL